MTEITIEYLNKLAAQFILISTLLGGFSLSAIITLIGNENKSKLMVNIFRLATVATLGFLITIFSMTKILMMTTKGFPIEVKYSDLSQPRTVGIFAFIIGLVAMLSLISLSGWTKSKSLGRFTTILGIIALIFILLAMIN